MTPQDPAPTTTPRRLTRATDDRMVAGVAAGIARHFELDPALVRIGFAVLALFGGFGLAIYAVCALVVPNDGGTAERSWLRSFALVVIVIAALVSFPIAGAGVLLLAPAAALGVLAWRAVGGTADPRLTRAALLVLAVVGSIALGIAAAIATAFGGGVWVAVAVVVAGVALIAGGFLGGARWLILPALLMALPVSVVSAADLELEGGVGEREYRPATVSEVRDSYKLGVGRLDVDLRYAGFEAGTTTELEMRIGVGDLELLLPPDVCVQSTAHAGAGDINLLGRRSEGVDVDAENRSEAPATAAVVVVDLHAGVGEIVVDQESEGACRTP